jgi:hypothetical protein
MIARRHDNGASMLVYRDRASDQGVWNGLVEEVAAALGLGAEAVAEPVDRRVEGAVDRLLSAAGDTIRPVLVLPARSVAETAQLSISAGSPHLRRALIASDASEDVVRGARVLSEHLRRGGVHTTVLVVLTGETVPPMWEGAGHHAAAWRHELSRRHGGPDSLRVVSGPPGPAVRSFCADADLLVLLWRQVAEHGRAQVVRSVLGDDLPRPCLLIPAQWVGRLRNALARTSDTSA